MQDQKPEASKYDSMLPLELLAISKNHQITVHEKGGYIYTGTFVDVDNYVNIILNDATLNQSGASDVAPQHFSSVLINGTKVTMIVPVQKIPEE